MSVKGGFMIIRLDANGLDALTIMDTLKRNGYYPVLTFKETDSKDSTYVCPYCISFDTEGQLVKGGDICCGDCDECPLCTPECEEWETCCNGAEKEARNSCEDEEECEYQYDTNNIKFTSGADLLEFILNSILDSDKKDKSRILNE